MHRPDPLLHVLSIDEIRPTQMTVGLVEVVERRKRLRAARAKDAGRAAIAHLAPGVVGPKGRFFAVDQHELLRALHDEGAAKVHVQVLADYSQLDADEFWINLEHLNWVHLYDETGRRREVDDLPRRVADLTDDPYRSLAAAVLREGGFASGLTPHQGFLWATFFRSRIDLEDLMTEFEDSVETATRLSHGLEASHLPGWCGVRS